MIRTLSEAEAFLDQFKTKTFVSRLTGDYGVERIQYFLALFGSPQDKLRVIHIAGTAGKGSVALVTSELLKTCGFKVGLTVSPHLLDIRERVQINNELLSEAKFVQYLNDIAAKVDIFNQHYEKPITYFELTMALAYYAFYREGVDYAVVETGLGGRYDASNCVRNPLKLCIITRLGLDHQYVLGKTIAEIAWQKAGIIQNRNTVVTLGQSSSRMKPIRAEIRLQAAAGYTVQPTKQYEVSESTHRGTTFDFHFRSVSLPKLFVSLPGAFQAENCSLALAAVALLSERDGFVLPLEELRSTLAHLSFFGRLSFVQAGDKEVAFDGAHNLLELRSLANTLRTVFPDTKVDFLIPYKRELNYQRVMQYLAPVARSVTVTSLSSHSMDLQTAEYEPDAVALADFTQSKHPSFRILPDQREALRRCLEDGQAPLVVTGSLYLLAPIYKLCLEAQ